MKILKFTLEGKTAFFKKPDVNAYLYFTYGNIHKIALLGIFGAILGYKGYNQMKVNKESKKSESEEVIFPEFYNKLKNLKVSIVPNNKNGFISKKVQVFNNSVGYASRELGGNLINKEQWLESPSWDIYVLVIDSESEKIANYIINNKCVYTPYLGKNDHYADINNQILIDETQIEEATNPEEIHSLCPKKFFEIDMSIDVFSYFSDAETIDTFKYEEQLPIGLDENTNMYIFENLMYTNMKLINKNSTSIYKIENKNIVFF